MVKAAGAIPRLYMIAKIAMGKRYGNISRNWNGTTDPIVCSPSTNAFTIPYTSAPRTIQNGLHLPNITAASAIHPCPAVIFSEKEPVVTKAM